VNLVAERLAGPAFVLFAEFAGGGGGAGTGSRRLERARDSARIGGRVNALCVVSRAREAAPSAVANLAPAAERGAYCFG